METHKIIKEICDLIEFKKFKYNKEKEVFVKKATMLDDDSEVEVVMDYNEIITDRQFIFNLSVFLYRKFNFIVSKDIINMILCMEIINLEFTAISIIYDILKK